jgi:hypothetical protein
LAVDLAVKRTSREQLQSDAPGHDVKREI